MLLNLGIAEVGGDLELTDYLCERAAQAGIEALAADRPTAFSIVSLLPPGADLARWRRCRMGRDRESPRRPTPPAPTATPAEIDRFIEVLKS